MSKITFDGEVKMISLKELLPDPAQPRQYFDEKEMDKLKDSIQDRGIMTPITVEPKVKGQHLIVDGERRFRVATYLKMKEVPVNILPKPLDEFDRNIVRFQLQETHKQWTPFEKAEAMVKLKEQLGLSNIELSRALAISPTSTARFLSLLSFPMSSRKIFIKEKAPLNLITDLSYTNNLMPESIKKEIPDFLNKILEKHKKGYLKGSHELRTINNLIRCGGYKYVKRFINQLDYTTTNAASDSGMVTDNFTGSITRQARHLVEKLGIVKKNDIKLNEEGQIVLSQLKESIDKL